jgi:hypothetical protein
LLIVVNVQTSDMPLLCADRTVLRSGNCSRNVVHFSWLPAYVDCAVACVCEVRVASGGHLCVLTRVWVTEAVLISESCPEFVLLLPVVFTIVSLL